MFRGIIGFLFISVLISCSAFGAKRSDDQCSVAMGQIMSSEWVKQTIRQQADAETKKQAIKNELVQEKGFEEAARNPSLIKRHNNTYTNELSEVKIADQADSGRCVLFTVLSGLTVQLIKDQKIPNRFEFSASYLHFYNMLEKANKFLASVVNLLINNTFEVDLRPALVPGLYDGGEFAWAMYLINKYGIVPKSVMPETASSQNTENLLKELNRVLTSVAFNIAHASEGMKRYKGKLTKKDQQKLDDLRKTELQHIITILRTHLGTPPEAFEVPISSKTGSIKYRNIKDHDYKRFTPKGFAREFAKINIDDYVFISNTSMWPEGQSYVIKGDTIGTDGQDRFQIHYLNLPVERMKELVTQAIDRGSPVYFGSDVESDVDAVTGIMHPDIFMSDSVYGFANTHSHEITKRSDRIFFEQTVPTHAMLMVGYDRPSKRGPVVKFKVVNSWGRDSGDQGIYHMYSDWFDGHVTDIVILKKLLSSRELRLWEKPSKVLDAEVHNYFKY